MKKNWLRIVVISALLTGITGAGVYASVAAKTGSVLVSQARPEAKNLPAAMESPGQNLQVASQSTQTPELASTPPTAQYQEEKPNPSPVKPQASKVKQIVSRGQSVSKGAIAYDWWTQASKYWPRGTVATVIDVRTGISFKVLRTMGTNHADVEPVTAADSQAIKRAWGGNFSWERRPVVVVFGNYRMAAGMTSMPEGSEQIAANGATGHMNLHFLNSRTHGSNRVDPNYQNAVKSAVGH